MELVVGNQNQDRVKERLESIRRTSSAGDEYWLARDLGPELGYPIWGNFEPVLKRAAVAMKNNGVSPSQHIVQTKKVVTARNNSTVEARDYFLSRGACYLIAMNGDPSKEEIAAAQAYFTIQTRRMEIQDAKGEPQTEDVKRLVLRGKVSASFKQVSRIASEVGVSSARQGLFHEQRYKGLYGASRAAVYQKKNLTPKEDILDRIGTLELSAHEFQMNLAASAIENENVQGEQEAIKKNLEIAQDVRRTIEDSGATLPEDLPLAEHISYIRKRLTGKKSKDTVTLPADANASQQLSLLSLTSVQK